MGKKYIAPSVKKTFEILRVVSAAKEGIGISELAKELKLAKSTVHGMTSALEEVGALNRDPVSKKYSLGFTLFELGRKAYARIDLKDLARPVLDDLMEKTQTSVFLGVRNWEHVTVLDIVESRDDLKITSPIGTTIPLLAGAVGKVFLASMNEEKANYIIRTHGLTKYTEHTITDPAKYEEEINRVRQNGYAIDDEEYILGVKAVAASIKGERRAAIWSVGFKASLNEEKMRVLIAATKNAAESINRLIDENSLRP